MPGRGLGYILGALEVGRINIAARAVGRGAGRVRRRDRVRAGARRHSGKPIAEHQAIQMKLADMATKLEAARLLTRNAAERKQSGERADVEAGMAKLFASETAFEIATEAMRIHGGVGYTTELPVERYYRDAPLMIIGEGTNEIQRLVIARGPARPRASNDAEVASRMTVHERPFGRYFEDFEPGDVYKHWPGKTITEYDDHLFCMITMNHHPLHTDAWFARDADPVRQERRRRQPRVLARARHVGPRRERRGDRQPRGRDAPAQEADVPRRHDLRRDEGAREEGVAEQARPRRRRRSRRRGYNQRGEEVCYFRRRVMVPKRDAAQPRRRPYDSPE